MRVRVERRHDDNGRPSKERAQRQRSYDRIIPIDPCVAAQVGGLHLVAGSARRRRRGSAFLFPEPPTTAACGTPLSDRASKEMSVIWAAICNQGPHPAAQLRHGWIQNLARLGLAGLTSRPRTDRVRQLPWAVWSYVRKMAFRVSRGPTHPLGRAFARRLQSRGEPLRTPSPQPPKNLDWYRVPPRC